VSGRRHQLWQSKTFAKGGTMKFVALIAVGLALTACAPSPENDPTLQALRANPPQEIPPDIWAQI